MTYLTQPFGALRTRASGIFPGLAVAVLVALAARYIAEHYGAPAMLMAMLFGIALNFLSEDSRCVAGIRAASTTGLRIGVAFLGFRVSVAAVAALGLPVLALIAGLVFLTIATGLGLSRIFGRGWKFGLLTGGSVAICGASAAVAIAAVLPKDERSEERLIFTVATVTTMSTLAMVLYPILAEWLGLAPRQAGIFIGASIHDVAQVMGAGFSMSPEVGDTATVVKLLRVALLGPIVLGIAFATRGSAPTSGKRPPILPLFVLGFIAACLVSSTGLIPGWLLSAAQTLASWLLLIAIAAVGLRTSLGRVLQVGSSAIAMVFLETVLLCTVALGGTILLG
ncbi:YeiH family protein [Alloyangia pacifica]|uniref:YeiH family protein n=1 Tax=Alloyangia pacifica TaxID=311180 RepID=UPI001CD2225D|nr:putative sulfate exporter family transporter [Alloyangia pacifica]MCA0997781.1 putative sulfate exporter family transporter [Alloyangia pacifica]